MKKTTDRNVGADEASAVPDVSGHATPSSAGAVIEPMGVDAIRSRILTIRGVQVMLDRDLAALYGVPTKVLNQAVKRNIERFPEEFMFAVSGEEMRELVTNCDRFKNMKHSSVPMRAFTEHGIIMLASVLRSSAATVVSVRITRTFVAMRRTLATLAPLLSRIEATERRQLKQEEAQVHNEERSLPWGAAVGTAFHRRPISRRGPPGAARRDASPYRNGRGEERNVLFRCRRPRHGDHRKRLDIGGTF